MNTKLKDYFSKVMNLNLNDQTIEEIERIAVEGSEALELLNQLIHLSEVKHLWQYEKIEALNHWATQAKQLLSKYENKDQ